MNDTDPHSQIRTTSADCLIHSAHKPTPHLNHRHHVWPLGEGGPNIEDNIVVACPTGHVNIHEVIKLYTLYMGRPPYKELRRFSFNERKYGKLGFDRITRKSM